MIMIIKLTSKKQMNLKIKQKSSRNLQDKWITISSLGVCKRFAGGKRWWWWYYGVQMNKNLLFAYCLENGKWNANLNTRYENQSDTNEFNTYAKWNIEYLTWMWRHWIKYHIDTN